MSSLRLAAILLSVPMLAACGRPVGAWFPHDPDWECPPVFARCCDGGAIVHPVCDSGEWECPHGTTWTTPDGGCGPPPSTCALRDPGVCGGCTGFGVINDRGECGCVCADTADGLYPTLDACRIECEGAPDPRCPCRQDVAPVVSIAELFANPDAWQGRRIWLTAMPGGGGDRMCVREQWCSGSCCESCEANLGLFGPGGWIAPLGPDKQPLGICWGTNCGLVCDPLTAGLPYCLGGTVDNVPNHGLSLVLSNTQRGVGFCPVEEEQ